MTPTPEQNAKRETPESVKKAAHEIMMHAARRFGGLMNQFQVEEYITEAVETELAELRQAADGMRDALDCIANQPDKTATGMRSCARESLARYRALAGEGVNQAG